MNTVGPRLEPCFFFPDLSTSTRHACPSHGQDCMIIVLQERMPSWPHLIDGGTSVVPAKYSSRRSLVPCSLGLAPGRLSESY